MLLLGEAGMGKSRFVCEIALGPGCIVVAARPGDASAPYATLGRTLRRVLAQAKPAPLDATDPDSAPPPRHELARVLPDLAGSAPLPAEGRKLVLQQAVEQLLASAAPRCIAVDDLHFADQASVDMLLALVGCERLQAVQWLLAQRPAEGGAAATLRDRLEEAHALATVVLAPLDEAEMAELVDSLGLPELQGQPIAAELVRHTGGNPLYALETLKLGVAEGSLGAVAAGPGAALRLPRPGSVGALIERRLRQLSTRALALARVAAVAGVDFHIELAELATGVRAVDLADAWAELEQARRIHEADGERGLEVELLFKMSECLRLVDDAARTAQVHERLLAIAIAADDGDRARAWLANETRRMDEAVAHARQALLHAQAFGDAELSGRSRLQLAAVLAETMKAEEARAQLMAARDWALQATAQRRSEYLQMSALVALHLEDFPGAVDALERLLAEPGSPAEPADLVQIHGNLAVAHAGMGAMRAALVSDERRRALAAQHDVGACRRTTSSSTPPPC